MLRGPMAPGQKLNLVGSDGDQYVHRGTENRLLSKCVKKSVKFGGARVMVWGMFCAAECMRPLVRLSGKVNLNVYQKLLQQHVVFPLRASPN